MPPRRRLSPRAKPHPEGLLPSWSNSDLPASAHILIVEDEPAIADTLVFALRGEGYTTTWMALAGDALEFLRRTPVDLVVLDVGLPDITGFEACRRLRRFSEVPVIFLTARGCEVDRIVGLELGADDYVVKPFSPREVATRVRTVLRRSGPAAQTRAAGTDARPGEFRIDRERLQIHYLEQPLQLTPHEYKLLLHLVAHPQRVFSREQLLEAIGSVPDAGYERNVDGHVKSLRAKLRQIAPDAEPIQTHRGFGYRYSPAQG
jgi:two-component system catabolic regulation response regulator CreB